MAPPLTRAVRALHLLRTDPRAFVHRIGRYLNARGSHKRRPARSGRIQVNGVNFDIDLGLDPRVRQMFYGTYGAEVTGVLRRFLRPGDAFIDAGANIGYITAFGLGLVGRAGEVHAFEPVPRYARRLRQVQTDNPESHLRVNEMALGETPGTAAIAITSLPNIGWNTMVPDFMSVESVDETIQVEVTTLDAYVAENRIPRLRLVKIDTEGFEFPVLKGFLGYLRSANTPPVLVVEIAPSAYPRLGSSLAELASFMTDIGYVAHDVTLDHLVDVPSLDRTTDVVFLPRAFGGIGRPGRRSVSVQAPPRMSDGIGSSTPTSEVAPRGPRRNHGLASSRTANREP